jgi:hypothetical protein
MLEGELSTLNDSLDLSKTCNHLYRTYVAAEHGILGHRVRIRIPACVVAFIRAIVPSPNNVYTGHRDVDDEGNEIDDLNESHHQAEPDSNVRGYTDFAAGEKVKITVSFENSEFDIAHISDFVERSPINGWNITFTGRVFTVANLICTSKEMFRAAFVYVYCITQPENYTCIDFVKVDE